VSKVERSSWKERVGLQVTEKKSQSSTATAEPTTDVLRSTHLTKAFSAQGPPEFPGKHLHHRHQLGRKCIHHARIALQKGSGGGRERVAKRKKNNKKISVGEVKILRVWRDTRFMLY
jgi:hypothetical protein